ncbi:MAG: hypothetical protein ACJATT_002650 [Myxococcota bacterium]|jgi:hypothetical protein
MLLLLALLTGCDYLPGASNPTPEPVPVTVREPQPLPAVGETRPAPGAEPQPGNGHILIHQGSQQGRPTPPEEVIVRSQCSEVTDGGSLDSNGITGTIGCGEQLVGHTRGGVQAFDTRFYEHHFCTPATTNHDGGDERVYRMSIPEGRLRPWVTLDTPCADLDLTVIKWSGSGLPTFDSSVADCEMFPKDGTTREIVDVTSDRATEWLIVVEGKDAEEGAFGLTVQCMPW